MGDNMVAVDLGVGRYPVAVTAGRWHTCVLMDNDEIKVRAESRRLPTIPLALLYTSVACVCGADLRHSLLQQS